MSKVYVFLADGCEEIEALTPVDLLRRAGIEVSTVSIMGRKTICSSHNIKIEADCLFEENDLGDGDAYVLPGGMPGSEHLAACEPLIRLIDEKLKQGRQIAAICAAPALVLGEHGFLKGKKATCFPAMESRLNCGEALTDAVVTDGNITTSRGMGTAIAFGLELIRLLMDEKSAKDMAAKIVY